MFFLAYSVYTCTYTLPRLVAYCFIARVTIFHNQLIKKPDSTGCKMEIDHIQRPTGSPIDILQIISLYRFQISRGQTMRSIRRSLIRVERETA